MAGKKDNKRLTAKTLIDKGKKQGSLTLSEIMEAFSETELDKDQVENLYETLGNLGIEIIEDKTPGDITKDKEGNTLAGTQENPYEIWLFFL